MKEKRMNRKVTIRERESCKKGEGVMNRLIKRERAKQNMNRRNLGIFISVSLLLLGGLTPAWAQRFEFTPFLGYQFGGQLSDREGDINIRDMGNFGFLINADVRSGAKAEFSYTRQETELELREYQSGKKRDLFKMAVEYYMLGGVYQVDQGQMATFGTLSLGIARFDPYKVDTDSEYRFAFSCGVGSKFFLSDRIGRRFQGRLLIPFQWAGGGLWCGTDGCSVGMSGGSSILQADVSGGLIFAFE